MKLRLSASFDEHGYRGLVSIDGTLKAVTEQLYPRAHDAVRAAAALSSRVVEEPMREALLAAGAL